jgi:hypothetical protein
MFVDRVVDRLDANAADGGSFGGTVDAVGRRHIHSPWEE